MTKPLLAALTALLLLAATAHAGTYTVHSCTTPDGTWVGAEGWTTRSSSTVVGRGAGQAEACTSPSQPMRLSFPAFGPSVAPGSHISLTLEAPETTTISSISGTRAFRLAWPIVDGIADRPYAFHLWHGIDETRGALVYTWPSRGSVSGGSTLSTFDFRDGSWAAVTISLRCHGLIGTRDCGPAEVAANLPRVTTELSDSSMPRGTASVPGGPLRGIGAIEVDAADAGSGVYRIGVEIDGVAGQRVVPDTNGGRCEDVDPTTADPYEFSSPRPCPNSIATSIALDTRRLPDGSHLLRVIAEDASGNQSTVQSATVVTHNAPVLVSAPSLAGSPTVGVVTASSLGEWEGVPTEFDVHWLRCDAGGRACSPITGASGVEYTPTAADAYRRLVVEVVAGNASGTATARSAPSAVVADAEGRTSPPRPAERDDEDDEGEARRPVEERRGEERPPAAGGGGGGVVVPNPVAAGGGHGANGRNASARARLALAVRFGGGGNGAGVRGVARFDRRRVVAGRLTDEAGRPIEGAKVTVLRRVVGRRWAVHGVVRTGEGGSVVVKLSPGPSREVRLAYHPFADSRKFVASRTVVAASTAPLKIGVNRRVVSGKRIVDISGRAGGQGVPRSGLLVTLQGHQRGWGWRTFRTVRTDGRGRWSTRYRFRSPSGRFAFRAVVPRQGSYPYASSTSAAVSVRVR